MFYLQITTKCNMHCPHCCFSCTNKGKHMSLDVFQAAVKLAYEWDSEFIYIGGGEPTLHPKFFPMLEFLLRYKNYGFDNIEMTTNGSVTKTMKRLFRILHGEDRRIYFAKRLSLAVSLDIYHDPIDPEIEQMVRKAVEIRRRHTGDLVNDYPYVYIKSFSKDAEVVSAGRAKVNNLNSNNSCACDSMFVKPSGNIHFCGCENSPIIGNVFNGIDPKWMDVYNSQSWNEYCIKEYKGDLCQSTQQL